MNKPSKNILLINKPLNWTSNDVVQKVKKTIGVKKIGHGGTLDPLATGLLVLGVNDGTKQMYQYLEGNKKYVAQIIFGFSTDTYDLEGTKTKESNKVVCINEIKEVLERLKLEYMQTPPIYSAIKVNGKKAYELARNQKEVKLDPRLVHLFNYDILSFKDNILELEVEVSKGFYIRSLAYDIGVMTNSASTLYSLKRTQIGQLHLDNAIEIEEVYDYWNK